MNLNCYTNFVQVFRGLRQNCFVGVNSLICPGVHIGNECVVGGGTIVTKDVPDNCMVVGVPAKIVKTGIHMNNHARLEGDFKYKE
jgi:acetyltransferase-like isoleucine patch superfamily enzyme